MLTAQQVAQFRTQAGLSPTPPPAASTSASSIINSRKEALGLNTPPALPPTPNVIQETASNYGENIAPAVADVTGGGNIGAAAEDLSKGKYASGIEKGTLGVASDAVKAIFAPLAAPIQTLLHHVATSNADNPSITSNVVNSPEAQAARQQLSDWAKAHPNQAQALSDAFTVGTAVIGSGGENNIVNRPVSELASTVKNTVTDAVGGVKNTVKGVLPESLGGTPAEITPETAATNFQKLEETISPKTSAKTLLQQGRVVPGQDPTLLQSGTADSVIPSTDTARIAKTISTEIPNATSMKTPALYNAMDAKVTDIATQLQPELAKIPVTEDMATKMSSDWSALKKAQIEDAPYNLEANVAKRQVKFETIVDKVAKGGTMDDLWQATKEYDASVKPNVKNPPPTATDDILQQHQEWLQNRRILTNVTHDVQTTLPASTQKMFSTMSDMYAGMQGIESTFKLTNVGAPSNIAHFFNETTPGKIIKYGGGVLGADKAIKGVTGIGL